ncbi:MAG: hypothetical protein V7L01_29025 [Nostoc sp.]|uniref:hypothetical protein n=1 Tax=Nostoc sp. TaxID=1180 RepID=UPI002FF76926
MKQVKFIQLVKSKSSNSSITPQRSPLLPKVLPIFSNSDRQPQAEAKNAFKNLLVGNFRT